MSSCEFGHVHGHTSLPIPLQYKILSIKNA